MSPENLKMAPKEIVIFVHQITENIDNFMSIFTRIHFWIKWNKNEGSPVLGDHNTGILVLCTILV